MLVCAVAVMFAMPAWGDGNVAKYGSDDYTTLQAALDKASKDTSSTDVTVTLTAGVSLDKMIELSMDKNLTIDLGTFDISADKIRALHIQSGKVTIKGKGVIHAKGTSDSSSVIRVGNSGKKTATLIVEKGVTISSDNCYGISIFGTNKDDDDDNYGQYLFFNGTVQVTGEAGAISGNGNSGNTSTDIVISPDAKIIASADSGIYHPQAGDLVIYGGEIEGNNGIEANIKFGEEVVINTAKDEIQRITETRETLEKDKETRQEDWRQGCILRPGALLRIAEPNHHKEGQAHNLRCPGLSDTAHRPSA